MNLDPEDAVSRRDILRTGVGAAIGGGLMNAAEAGAAAHREPSVYERIGVKHVINATGTVTFLGGSIMPPEVVAAWTAAARHFVNLHDLQAKVGVRIAELLGVEAALVTTGAAGALLLGTAAVLTGGRPELVKKLPDTSGMKNEVILQKSHHSCYDNQLTAVGVRLITVETRSELERALGERTALMFFMNIANNDGAIKREEWIEIARERRVPTMLDAAADVPPVEHLSSYLRAGFDLVAFSGGKALMGPNDTGLLLGRRDLIEAARLNANPHCPSLGRMMKVSKEDMMALLAAVERYLKVDHQAEWRKLDQRAAAIMRKLAEVPTVRCERIIPPIANHVPHLLVHWDETQVRISRQDVMKRLLEGDPPVQLGRVPGTGDSGLLISVFMLQDGEEVIVADRLRTLLVEASRKT